MAKGSNNQKQTRAQKIAAGDESGKQAKGNKGQQAAKAPKAVKPPKEKGPRPNFTPNHEREQAAARLVFATRIADERIHFPALVAGEHGKYLVGINHSDWSEAHDFEVRTEHVKGKDGADGYDIVTIQGEVSANPNKPGVSIPLSWLFKENDNYIRFTPGAVGEIQRDMLCFLKDAMFHAIEDQKELNKQEQAAARAAAEAVKNLEDGATTGGDMFKLATVDGKAVKPQKTVLAIKSLLTLAPKEFGRYDFKDSANKSCVVDYVDGNDGGKSVLRVHSMNADHELALAGIGVGLEMFALHLNKEVPLPEGAEAQLVLFRQFCIDRVDAAHAKAALKAA